MEIAADYGYRHSSEFKVRPTMENGYVFSLFHWMGYGLTALCLYFHLGLRRRNFGDFCSTLALNNSMSFEPTTSACHQQPRLATNNLGLPPTTSAYHQQPRLATNNLSLLPTTTAFHQQPQLTTNNLCSPPTTSAHHQQPLLTTNNHSSPLITSAPCHHPMKTSGLTKLKTVGRSGAL